MLSINCVIETKTILSCIDAPPFPVISISDDLFLKKWEKKGARRSLQRGLCFLRSLVECEVDGLVCLHICGASLCAVGQIVV